MGSTADTTPHAAQTIVGTLSGKTIRIPNVNAPPMPMFAAAGVIHNGVTNEAFGNIGSSARGYPDACSFARRFGLLIPATNTIMEHELWSIIFNNQSAQTLAGVGLHTTTVLTPKPVVDTAEGLENFKQQFLGGLETAVHTALLAAPQYLIMGLSLEHILEGIDPIRESMTRVEQYCDLSWATWHDAVTAALACYRAKRIGILTAWERLGNASAIKMFEDLGFEVVSSIGFSCGNVQHIAHIPDWAKEKAIMELLATAENRLDAVVQCGTNMSMIGVAEKLEPRLGIPILGINATTFWFALRENGFDAPIAGGGRLLREF